MRRRVVLALGLLALLVALAGCSSVFGTSEPSQSDLSKNATYEWDTNASMDVSLSRSSFKTVLTVENRSWVKVYTKGQFGDQNPLSVKAVRYRYPNGTVVEANKSWIDVGGSKTNLTLPQAGGKVAFKSGRPTGKSFSTPLFLEGEHSVEVTMPSGARVGVPFLSSVSPNDGDRWVENNRMTIRWNSIDNGPISVRFYLVRDLFIFGGLLLVLVVVGGGGTLYYFRQIRGLERRREEIGLDVEVEDDDFDDDGPPPGMR